MSAVGLVLLLQAVPADAPARPSLDLPPPPAISVRKYESDPPGARIEDTLRLDPSAPWLLAGVGAVARLSGGRGLGLAADARLVLPIKVYGHGRIGLGLAPLATLAALGASTPDHASLGVAAGVFESRRDFYTGPSGLVASVERALPLSRAGGERAGLRCSLVFLARGPFVSLAYVRIPTDEQPVHSLSLSVGVNLFGELFR